MASFDPQDHRVDIDVAVVGGGPGGLACAAAVEKFVQYQATVSGACL